MSEQVSKRNIRDWHIVAREVICERDNGKLTALVDELTRSIDLYLSKAADNHHDRKAA